MKHSHWLCGVFGAAHHPPAVLGAGAWTLIPAAGCAAACAHMVWTMVRTGQHRTGYP